MLSSFVQKRHRLIWFFPSEKEKKGQEVNYPRLKVGGLRGKLCKPWLTSLSHQVERPDGATLSVEPDLLPTPAGCDRGRTLGCPPSSRLYNR